MSPELDIAARKPTGSDPTNPSLVEQAEGLGRAAVMKDVVGPALTKFLSPLYEGEIAPEEKKSLFKISDFKDISNFYNNLREILVDRLRLVKDNNLDEHSEVHRLGDNRSDLFYYDNEYIFLDGIESSVFVPLAVATQIYRMERENSPKVGLDFAVGLDSGDYSIGGADLAEIMERESFDKILLSLTKGPNGFLSSANGMESISFSSDDFFGFIKPDPNPYSDNLSFTRAFEIEDGKVIGLSEEYHVAANKKRKKIRDEQEKEWTSGHRPADSSGCPVRHSFSDPESGASREPLVIAAKKFLVKALRASDQQSPEAA